MFKNTQYSNLYVIVLVPESERVLSICLRNLDPETLQLTMNLEDHETTTKTHLICTDGYYKTNEIEEEMNENICELKYVDYGITLSCRLSVNFSSVESDSEKLKFSLEKGQLSGKLKKS